MDNQDNQEKQVLSLDIDDVISGDVQQTKKVGVVFDDEGEPAIGFVIVGRDSEQYRKRASELRSLGIKRQAVKKTRIDTKTEEGALAFAKILEENEFELAVAVVVGYFGLTSKGQPVPCTAEMTRKLFTAKPSWRERVSASLEVEEGFLKLSSTNSAISRAVNSASTEEAQTE